MDPKQILDAAVERAKGDPDKLARMELLRAYLLVPEFRTYLHNLIAQINNVPTTE